MKCNITGAGKRKIDNRMHYNEKKMRVLHKIIHKLCDS
ncbi:hypothetical protein HMPREF1039_0348 [Megasphaera lornae]|uniref:Uncharacterized protein n=1 Tax=Megasphaera lornae TaxID=1000568 RepID=A0ABN0CZF9_9FIRM|nr:hypothetical protein HMPREF1039_0348 [Megasphaera lornae]